MHIKALYGYIPNPNKPEEGDPLYILKEEQLSSSLYRYSGFLGHGYHKGEFREGDWESGRVIDLPEYPIPFIKYDMRDFAFTYDSEKGLVTVECYWRFESYEKEAKSLTLPIETDVEDDDDEATSYPYFRFPRTKDGVAISRVFCELFGEGVKVFASKEYLD